MDILNVAALVVYSALIVGGLIIFRKVSRGSPFYWFLPFQFLAGGGAYILMDFEATPDLAYAGLRGIAIVTFILTAAVVSELLRVRQKQSQFWGRLPVVDGSITISAMAFLLALSVAVTVVYYQAVGYNMAVAIMTGSDLLADYSSARLAMYSGEQYFYPGYVNQFKNVLLPLALSVLLVGWWARGRYKWSITGAVLFAPFMIYALAGTGQRAFIVHAVFAFMFGAVLLYRPRLTLFAIPLAAMVTVFAMFTAFYQLSADSRDGFGVAGKVVQRVVFVQPEGAIIGFRYVYADKEIAWLGEWGRGLRGLLPRVEGSRLAHEVHMVKYGSDRGTIPLSNVGSAYHNGGVLGVLLWFSLAAGVYVWLYHRLLSGKRTVVRCMTYGAIFYYLASHMSGGPITLVDNGVVALFGVLIIRKILAGLETKIVIRGMATKVAA